MQVPESHEHLPRRLWWVLGCLTLIWGANWPVMKVAISEVAPFTFRTLCLAVGSGVLFTVLRASGRSIALPRSEWRRLALIAFFTITCWNLLVVFGLASIASGRGAILAYTMPAWAIPLSVWLLGERLSARKLAGLVLGMAAMGLLLWDEFARLQRAPLGALFVLGAALTWAIGTVLQKKYPVRVQPGAYTAWLMLVGGAPIYLGTLVFEDFARLFEIGPKAALATAYTVLLAFAWAHWAWIKLATTVSVTVFSLSMLTVPVVGVLSGMLVLGEQPGWSEFGALALVLGSLLSVALPERARG